MARGVNKAILIGALGADPDVKYTKSGKAVTNISIATNEEWKDKESGEKKQNTEWHRVVFFDKLAEIASQYLNKGSQVYVEGRIQTRKWQDKEGNDKYTTEIIAHEMQMLGGKDDRKNNQEQSNQHAQAQAQAPADNFDDDIPF